MQACAQGARILVEDSVKCWVLLLRPVGKQDLRVGCDPQEGSQSPNRQDSDSHIPMEQTLCK